MTTSSTDRPPAMRRATCEELWNQKKTCIQSPEFEDEKKHIFVVIMKKDSQQDSMTHKTILQQLDGCATESTI